MRKRGRYRAGCMLASSTHIISMHKTNIAYNLLLAWLRIGSSGQWRAYRGSVGRHSGISGCGVGGLAG